MSRVSVIAFYAILGLGSVVVSIAGQDHYTCPTGFANFGDSFTDTGNEVDAFPVGSGGSVDNRPYGETFFGAPAKRASNGRLVPDFFSLAFRVPLLDPFFAITGVDYRHGANFAAAGAMVTAADVLPGVSSPFSVVPVQVNQFIRFKNSVRATQRQGTVCESFLRKLPSGDPFANWLYTIQAGANDIFGEMYTTPIANITSTFIQTIVASVSTAIEILYRESARKFLVYNVPALGCSSMVLTRALLANLQLHTDSLGCIESVNQLIQGYNAGLFEGIEALRVKLPGVSISLFDLYAADIEILTHPATYGFNPTLTKTTCCGAPGLGTLNYNPAILCGTPNSNNCANPDEYVMWDGTHYTENFYRTIAEFALSGNFTDQGIDYKTQCNLDFSMFGPGVTYEDAYPVQCNNLFT